MFSKIRRCFQTVPFELHLLSICTCVHIVNRFLFHFRIRFLETYQLSLHFIVEVEVQGFETVAEGNRLYHPRFGHRFVAFLEAVIRDAGVEVMDVVVADVAGKPSKQGRKIIERTAD
jgi:hypothetical protein